MDCWVSWGLFEAGAIVPVSVIRQLVWHGRGHAVVGFVWECECEARVGKRDGAVGESLYCV